MATHHRGIAGLVRRLMGAWAPWLQAAGDRKQQWALDVATLYHNRVGTTPDGDVIARSHLLDVRRPVKCRCLYVVAMTPFPCRRCSCGGQIVATKPPPRTLGRAPDGQEPFTIAFAASAKKLRKFFAPLGDLARRHGVRVLDVGEVGGDDSQLGAQEHEYADVIIHKVWFA